MRIRETIPEHTILFYLSYVIKEIVRDAPQSFIENLQTKKFKIQKIFVQSFDVKSFNMKMKFINDSHRLL